MTQNPSTLAARAFVAALDVADVVIAPGSRSAPIAMALADRAQRGDVRLHVRIDERSAAFLALGLARGSERPVAVLCTSGTAAVNLAPAVIEAHEDGVPLLVLTADRPAELRGVGASQTIDQIGIFGRHVPVYDIEAPDGESDPQQWAQVAAGALAHALERSGPVQINLQFREPLVPEVTA